MDFAHTPQAVAAAAGRRSDRAAGSSVLGCGGDRDPEKRRPMGAAAAPDADVVVVTDDNPRTEDPAAIRAEVLAGARPSGAGSGGPPRWCDGATAARPSRRPCGGLGPGDVVAVLGKGHERGQEMAGQVLPFDDAEVAARGVGGASRLAP